MKSALVLLAVLGLSAHALPVPKSNRLPVRTEAVETPEFDEGRFGDVEKFEEDLSNMTPAEMSEEFDVDIEHLELEKKQRLFTPVRGAFLQIVVDIDTQRLYMSGTDTQEWVAKVSTGRGNGNGGKGITGNVIGHHNPYFLSKDHRSKKYSNAAMPWAVFFSGNYALHETPYVKLLGTKASHGCVRQNHTSAKYVFETVTAYKKAFGFSAIDVWVR